MAEPDTNSIGRSSAQANNSQLENIKVAVRLRPFTEKEKQRDNRRIVDIEKNTVVLYNPKYDESGLKKFTFDHSYWSHDGFMKDHEGVNIANYSHINGHNYVGQEEVFNDLGKFLLSNAIEGYNSALLAYGQTGSGKSYTVSGYGKNEGILPRFARTLFEELDLRVSSQSTRLERESKELLTDKKDGEINRYEIFFSMIEIYNEVVRDLLAKNENGANDQTSFLRRGLKIREHPKRGFFVENLTSHICSNKEEIARLIDEGQLNKSIAATSMNETSSRGHTIYEFKIKQYKLKSASSPDEVLTSSVVQLVDLAGSERLAVHVTSQTGRDTFLGSRSNLSQVGTSEKSGKSSRGKIPNSASSNSSSAQLVPVNHQRRFKESVSINQSLSALGNCIQIMSQYSQQAYPGNQTKRNALKIPYRDSALTKLLNRCCLSGNSKVVIIATLSPIDSSYDDTLSTLRFADRAKQIRTHAVVNRMSRNEMTENSLKTHQQFKPIDGRITRSDDSSQTSNFDDSENLVENLTGRRSRNQTDVVASPIRSRTTVRRGKGERSKKEKNASIDSSSSNPSLIVREQMKRLVSPAQKNTIEDKVSVRKKDTRGSSSITSSQTVQDLATGNSELVDNVDDYLEDVDLESYDIDDDLDIEGFRDSAERESEISSSDTSIKELPNEDKIVMVNRMLSESIGGYGNAREDSLSRSMRPKKASRNRARHKYLSSLNSELKKTNPYLSNLNMDEQLSGVITYLIKLGETIVGKGDECDVVLRGTELRGKHAKIIRVAGNESGTSSIFIEPYFEDGNGNLQNVAVKVNGSSIYSKTQINHGDRIIFGTNAYFVLVDNKRSKRITESINDSSVINYESAKNEVMQKMMEEDKNGATMREISDYTYRPGTGKRRANPSKKVEKNSKPQSADLYTQKGARGLTEGSKEFNILDNTNLAKTTDIARKPNSPDEENRDQEIELKEAQYRNKLMEDTYEFAIPVAEVNAIAKEMGIRINYSLKILTGDEQLPEQSSSNFTDSSASDRSSSLGDVTESENERIKTGTGNRIVIDASDKLDALDKPPALFIRAHHEDLDADFYWSKEKFQARRYKIMELYGAWDSGGKSGLVEYLIDQSKIGGEYMIDPFWDDPNNISVLIGHSQITLKPIAHLSGMNLHFDILNFNDETSGQVNIEAIPCCEDEIKLESNGHVTYRPYSEKELEKLFLEDPKKLIDTKLVFLLKIISCCDIPDHFGYVYCQYNLSSNCSMTKTRVIEDTGANVNGRFQNLHFNHQQYISFEKVNVDILDFFEHGFLTIQVVGKYRLDRKLNASQTVVTTIINSINKYKYKLEQDSYNGLNDTSGSYYNSDSTHSNQVNPASLINSNSGASSVGSTSATVNMFDQQNEDDEALNGLSQENVIDMILTKRKLDRAENQLEYLKRTINIAEHYNKKHIPVKTVKKLLNSYGQRLDEGSLEDISNDVSTTKSKTTQGKHSGCMIQ